REAAALARLLCRVHGQAVAGGTGGSGVVDLNAGGIDAILDRCVHCGFCLSACPTYDLLREEPDSPRGRIALIDAVAEGRLEPGERFALHMYRCVGCRACETACPAGVEFGRLLEWARAQVGPPGPAAGAVGKAVRAALRHVLPDPRRTRLAAAAARWFSRSWLRRQIRAGFLFGPAGETGAAPGSALERLARLDALLP